MDAAHAIAHDDWHTLLDAHPIFHFQPARDNPRTEQALELSTSTLSTSAHPDHDCVLSGRRQLMALKDADLIVAAGSELRITSIWDTKLGRETGHSYKVRRCTHTVGATHGNKSQVLHVPNVDFQIHQLSLNPSGKLLAVAGAYQVAVVVLPRAGYAKIISSSIDCKYDILLPLSYLVLTVTAGRSKWASSITGRHPQHRFPRLTGTRGERQDQRSWS